MNDNRTLRAASNHAEDVLSAVYEAWCLTGRNCKSALPAVLYQIEARTKCLADALRECEEAFIVAREPHGPVLSDDGDVAASVHELILDIGLQTEGVTFDLMRAAYPELHKPNVEYFYPKLCCEDDILTHITTAVESFKRRFPSEERLNWIGVARKQELARALASNPDDSEKELFEMKLSLDDRHFLTAAISEGAINSVFVDSNQIFYKATHETNCPRELRERLKKYGLIGTAQGKGITVLPKGERYVQLMSH